MECKIIKDFAKDLGEHGVTVITGPMSPLLVNIPWSADPACPMNLLTINRGRDSVLGLDEYYYHLCAENRLRQYLSGESSIEQLRAEYGAYEEACRVVYEETNTLAIKEEGAETLLKQLQRIVEALEATEKTLYIETLDDDMVLRVIGKEKESLLRSVWERATQPTFVSFEGRWLKEVVDRIKRGESSARVIPSVRYIYTDYHWTLPDEQILRAVQEIEASLQEKEQRLFSLQNESTERLKEHESWRAGLSTDEKELVDYIQLAMLLRDIRKDSIAKVQAAMILIVTELFIRADIDPTYAATTNVYECLQGIDFLRAMRGALIKRANGSVRIMRRDRSFDVEVCDYEEAVRQFHDLTDRRTVNTEEIKGSIANKGQVVGTVRRVLDPLSYNQPFNRGDVLVTGMTRPEFVPLMKLAGAIVTDEGGVTCHAAIVSRELGVPCVIGTKRATRLLRDGDLVEVNADNGTIRILERAAN